MLSSFIMQGMLMVFGNIMMLHQYPKDLAIRIVRYVYVPLLDDRNVNDEGLDAQGATISNGNLYGSSRDVGKIVGKMPGQNTPATTTMATIEQGMKLFTAVYKRIYRSLQSEYKKLFKLNKVYLNPEKYVNILDTQVIDRKSTRLNSSHLKLSRMPSSA